LGIHCFQMQGAGNSGEKWADKKERGSQREKKKYEKVKIRKNCDGRVKRQLTKGPSKMGTSCPHHPPRKVASGAWEQVLGRKKTGRKNY